MDRSRRLASNALANVMQALGSALLLFALYRYVSTTLGVDQLGIWSVIMASASAARLADLGLGASVTRFVAQARAQAETSRAAQVVETVVLTLAVITGLGMLPLHVILVKVFPHLFDREYLSLALKMLPYALASLWLTFVAAVFQGGLDGCQRMDLRAALLLLGQALFLALSFWLVPKLGLLGLVWAQIGQGLFLAVIGYVLLRRVLPELAWLPRRWNRNLLRPMLGYGVNVQAASVFMLLLDPITKALMARFGGPVAAGYFELANQVVQKARALIVSANQAIVPYVATIAEADLAGVGPTYRANMRVLFFVTLPTLAFLFVGAPIFSWILVGSYEAEFIALIDLLALAWVANLISVPAYFVNLGAGHVGWNSLTHAIVGLLNVTLAWLLGRSFGAQGVAYAYAISLAAGSYFLITVFHRIHRLDWRYAFAREHVWLVVACVVAGLVSWLAPVPRATGTVTSGVLAPLVLVTALGVVAWFHPVRRTVWRHLRGA